MKSVNDFVRKDISWPETFKDQMKKYKKINKSIEKCISIKESYDQKCIKEDPHHYEFFDKLTFKENLDLYRIIDSLIKNKSGDFTYLGIDLLDLRYRLEAVYKDINCYIRNLYKLESLKKERNNILTDNISFDVFYEDYFSERCDNKHYLVRLDDELKCMGCGATIKDYSLSKEELDFLTLCAEKQGLLLKEVTKDDLPLLQVLMEKQDYYRSLRNTFNPFDLENENYLEEAEEAALANEAELPELKVKIRIAHLLDSQTYESGLIRNINSKYLSEEKAKELLLEVEKELKKVKKINSRFKDLMIEECNTAKYEILILAGAHIPTLLKQTQNEADKIALTKAYYNISNDEFRNNSEYFASKNDRRYRHSYDCLTANPEINNRILEMKIKR